MNTHTSADTTNLVTEGQTEALMSAALALADECAVALMEARLGSGDAVHLAQMVGQARLFLRPPDGLEPLPAVWATGIKGRLSKVPPLTVLAALRRCGFTDDRIAKLAGCSRMLILRRRTGKDVRRPSGRI